MMAHYLHKSKTSLYDNVNEEVSDDDGEYEAALAPSHVINFSQPVPAALLWGATSH